MDKYKIFTMLQICDSAFPTGGFSHSMGAESAIQHHQIKNKDDLKNFILSCIENIGSCYIPFIKAAYEEYRNIEKIVYLDSLLNASLLNHVSHRASKQQGKSFLTTSYQVYPSYELLKVMNLLDVEKIDGHLAIIFPVVCASLNIDAMKVLEMFLFNSLRTVIASAVRLGKIGAIQAQKVQYEIEQLLDSVIMKNWTILPEDSCISFPLTEILQNIHDTMFTKMFYS